MAVTVRISTALRRHTGGLATVQAVGSTVREVLADAVRQFPGLGATLYDEQGGVREYVNVFVDGEHIRHLAGWETPVSERSEVAILPAAAGG